ncbi:MAG: hypothetical protein ACK5NK_16400 [Niabella sp.]
MAYLYKIIFLFAFYFPLNAFCQTGSNAKMQDVFLLYIHKKLELSNSETAQMRPLVAQYFANTRKLYKEFTDPLEREQQKINLKLQYRNLFTPIIGKEKANRFFIEEQLFRKRVREELKQRRKS